jgi:hypothetical protein
VRPLAPRLQLSSLALAPLALASGCLAPSSEAIAREVRREMALTEPEVVLLGTQHRGPKVARGNAGTARFAEALYAAFDKERAMGIVRFLDGHYRAPANDGYEASLGHVEEQLRSAGYGSQEGFELGVIETPLTGIGPQAQQRLPAQAWTPLSGRLTLRRAGEKETVLHEFSAPGDVERVMLPIHAPSADVEGPIALSLEDLEPGEILATEAPPSLGLLMRAQSAGAAAVLSANLEPYNVDPSGKKRHFDALQFCIVPVGTSIPVAMISPRSLEAIRASRVADSGALIALRAEVRFDERPLRTLFARVVGADRPAEVVVIGSHVQEPGACDNASGVAGLCEGAIGLAELIRGGRIERPSRSLVFLWGDEFRQTECWLDQTELRPVAGLSSDMTGESAATGAIALLERMPDPGAVQTLPPDEHTLWGKTEVDPAALTPNGLAVIARSALVDVAEEAGGWVTADHPYEGGSDHDVFIERGIPAALFWHFTDFTYHTSMDRLEFVDPEEMRRTGSALMTTALALADPRPGDLERYLDSLDHELDLRVSAAEGAGDAALAKLWREWCHGARQWLRSECLRIPPGELAPEERR